MLKTSYHFTLFIFRELEEKYLEECSATDKAAYEHAKAMKAKLKEEMAEYRKSLLDQACQGREEKDLLDATVAREYQIICDREDAAQQAQANARDKLAREVHSVRASQLNEKEHGGTCSIPEFPFFSVQQRNFSSICEIT